MPHRHTEQFTRAILEHAPDVISILGPGAEMLYQSPAIRRVLGYDEHELIGLDAMSYVHPDDLDRVRAYFGRVVEGTADGVAITFRLRHKDGTWRWVEVMHNNQLENPSVRGIVVNFRDVTDRVEMETALRATTFLLDALVDSSPIGIIASDGSSRIRIWNPAAHRILGRPSRDMIGHDVEEAGIGRLPSFSAGANTPVALEITHELPDGRPVDIGVVVAPLGEAQSGRGVVAFLEDITERKAAAALRHEQQITQLTIAQRERQLTEAHLQMLQGRLRPHFLFNTLQSIATLMHRDVDEADRMMVNLGVLLRQLIRGPTRQLVTVGEEVDFLNAYLQIEQVRLGDRLEVAIHVAPQANRRLMPQFLLQPLVENALRHGIRRPDVPLNVAVRITADAGNRLKIVIADNGRGLPEGFSLDRAGTGISATRGRLEQLYGSAYRFAITPRRGGGVRVSLELPLWRSDDEP